MSFLAVVRHVPALAYAAVAILATITFCIIASHVHRRYVETDKLWDEAWPKAWMGACVLVAAAGLVADLVIAAHNGGSAMSADIAFSMVVSSVLIVTFLNIGESPKKTDGVAA